MRLLLCRLAPSLGRKEQHIAAYSLLSALLYESHGLRCARIAREELGRPYLSDYPIQFSLSHCKGMAVCVLGDTSPVGVDVEPLRTLKSRVAQRCFSADELRQLEGAENPDLLFTRLWTLKESYVKAIGQGISFPMRTISFVLDDAHITETETGYRYTQFLTEDGFVISVCHRDADGTCRRLDGPEEFQEQIF